jgi:hypothetical protein
MKMAIRIVFEYEKDAYVFLDLCRIIAKVLDETERLKSQKF